MESPFVTYTLDGPVATIAMDDGKRNAISPRMIAELGAALDRAEADRAVVVLTGREGVFSAGFDLRVLGTASPDALTMLRGGFALAERILAFPLPVVAACNGHAIAMGVFLLLACDYRIGVEGPYRFHANEVAIGLPVPHAGIAICRERLSPAHFQRAVLLAEPYAPGVAIEAGFLDRVVFAHELAPEAKRAAEELAKLDLRAHAITKLRAREPLLRALRSASSTDLASFLFEGARRFVTAKSKGRGAAA